MKRYAATQRLIRALANFLEAIFNFPRVVICKEDRKGKGEKRTKNRNEIKNLFIKIPHKVLQSQILFYCVCSYHSKYNIFSNDRFVDAKRYFVGCQGKTNIIENVF